MRTFAFALVLCAGCGTRTELVICHSNADCSEGFHCDLPTMHCLRIIGDGGADGDGSACDQDHDGVDGPQCGGTDCDDSDATRFPGNPEICNGQDDDCDDTTPEGTDADGDDYCAEGGPLPCCAGTEVDCCDTDADAKPGQTDFFATETTCGGFDYDCSHTEELQFTQLGGCLCNATVCQTTAGWDSVGPGCGGTGDWVSGCTGTPCTTTCTPMTDPTPQGCH
jgi:putative metal-binding protein